MASGTLCPLIPIEIRPHVRAALAARRAGEPSLDVGKPNVIGPSLCADRRRVTAAMVFTPLTQEARMSSKVILPGRSELPTLALPGWVLARPVKPAPDRHPANLPARYFRG